jgi:hypothetical protein
VDKVVVSTQQIQAIADLPSREVCSPRSSACSTPRRASRRVLNEPASALARLLKAMSKGRRAPLNRKIFPGASREKPMAATVGGRGLNKQQMAPRRRRLPVSKTPEASGDDTDRKDEG